MDKSLKRKIKWGIILGLALLLLILNITGVISIGAIFQTIFTWIAQGIVWVINHLVIFLLVMLGIIILCFVAPYVLIVPIIIIILAVVVVLGMVLFALF